MSFFQGTTFPALNAMLARWAPISERGRMGSLVFGGAQIGNIAGTYLSGLVMKNTGDWRPVFYLFGALGLLWFILWVRFHYLILIFTYVFLKLTSSSYQDHNVKCLLTIIGG